MAGPTRFSLSGEALLVPGRENAATSQQERRLVADPLLDYLVLIFRVFLPEDLASQVVLIPTSLRGVKEFSLSSRSSSSIPSHAIR